MRTDEAKDALTGLLLGLAVGDALGLPAEGMRPQRIRKRWHGVWKHRLVFGRGMISDDTEHALFTAQALLAHGNDVDAFGRSLAWKLRWWLLSLPAAIGFGTLRACVKLWLGVVPSRSGVWSAGTAPAVRAAVIGACFGDDAETLERVVRASTLLTHTDPKALTGALAVAHLAARTDGCEVFERLESIAPDDDDWCGRIATMRKAHDARLSVTDFAREICRGDGVSGYVYETVPVAVYAWLRHPGDFRAALTSALNCGGDTDTVGAIVGALAGATVGEAGIPREWIDGICDWPRSVAVLREAAERLSVWKSEGRTPGPVRYFRPAVLPRNLFFLTVVLCHALRRLLPPY